MRKREHASFVTLMRLMSLSDMTKSVTAKTEEKENSLEQTEEKKMVINSRVVGVMSDGMLTKGI